MGTPLVRNKDAGACIRCGGTATKRLDFISETGGSRVFMCDNCFEWTKQVFTSFVLHGMEVEIKS